MSRHPEGQRLKAMDLRPIAALYGYALDEKESGRASQIMRHPDGDKIVIATDKEDGHAVFYSVRTDAHGSVFDFVMYRDRCDFRAALETLRRLVGSSLPTVPPFPRPRPEPIPRDRAALLGRWHRFAPYGGSYLESRGLRAATIEAAADRIRTDERGNAVFRHDDRDGLAGWEIKNRGFTGYADGGRKALFAARMGLAAQHAPPRLVVAESAIDALSFWQLDPTPAVFLSFAGGMSPDQTELLRHVLTKHPAAQVLAATDADEQGERYAATIADMRPDAIRVRPPTGKDWNDALRSCRNRLLGRGPSKNAL